MATAPRSGYPDVALHLIGPLQSNKALGTRWRCSTPSMRSTARPSCEALAKEIARQGRSPLLLRRDQYRRRGAETGVAAAGRRRVPARLPRHLRAHDLRPDVHSAPRGAAGTAFCAHRQDRAAQRPVAAVHGHERRLRIGGPVRRHACARGDGHLRGADNKSRLFRGSLDILFRLFARRLWPEPYKKRKKAPAPRARRSRRSAERRPVPRA